ncbi:hypothetical protein ACPYPG_31520 [Streptomyces sp. FR-108]|uniref:hypothetical protein n=1 Tax=Streptomyces sp. FR-108 TaxID=3416665 RepID=UPI003CF5A56C
MTGRDRTGGCTTTPGSGQETASARRQEIDELFGHRGLPMLIGARDPLLAVLPLGLDTVPREIGITTLADRQPSASTRLLIKEIVAVARETDPVLLESRR